MVSTKDLNIKLMNLEKQMKLAESFQQLHKGKGLLLLPNVWDAGSALVSEKLGFNALGTTSAGIAYTLGYADGQKVDLDDLCWIVRHITSRVNIPVSVDFENGYADTPEQVIENAQKLLDLGAVGFNIEDGLSPTKLDCIHKQCDKIDALVSLKKRSGVNFVINARSCVYWNGIGTPACQFKEAIERGNAYAMHGADCVFIPGVLSKKIVSELVKELDAPLNVIANPKFYDLQELESIGVKRLSIGSGLARTNLNHYQEKLKHIKDGKLECLFNNTISYSDANDLFADDLS